MKVNIGGIGLLVDKTTPMHPPGRKLAMHPPIVGNLLPYYQVYIPRLRTVLALYYSYNSILERYIPLVQYIPGI